MNPLPAPNRFENEEELEEFMTRPSAGLIEDLSKMEGDLILLGVGGKMGPTLARLAKRALLEAGNSNRVIGVSRFSNPAHRETLEQFEVETISCDLLDPDAVHQLPDAPNVIFLVGMKFGTTGSEAKTWAVNTITPSNMARRYEQSRIVALSTGNVYPLTEVSSGGPTERDLVGPVGEYAQSALARERVFQYFSEENGIPMAIIRLNYAIDVRYGVLLDIGKKVLAGHPIDLTMGYANVIWQGDANKRILRSLRHCASPPEVINLTGTQAISVREAAVEFGRRMEQSPIFVGEESESALLSNASKYAKLFGEPETRVDRMIGWIAEWLKQGGETLDKPTHFETRDGKF
ncbi:MAG: NAD(P)-dependent oxidoreductase [Candidatus Omnitrophica bacterium]|nr:NAD(P)-dependent oxidoreductase [Candidatus Omnitrophota bacterium]